MPEGGTLKMPMGGSLFLPMVGHYVCRIAPVPPDFFSRTFFTSKCKVFQGFLDLINKSQHENRHFSREKWGFS